jgi:hypothetical protein
MTRREGTEHPRTGSPGAARSVIETGASGRGSGATPLDPGWEVPAPYGAPFAIQSLSTVAAPLLAGFSVTLSGVILQAAGQFRWPGLTLLLLAIATVMLLFCVQCGFWARHEFVLPEEARQWWGDFASSPSRRDRVAEEQRRRYRSYRRWARSARVSYDSAIVALLAGMSVALAPVGGGGEAVLRWMAALAFLLAAAGEVVWAVSASRRAA